MKRIAAVVVLMVLAGVSIPLGAQIFMGSNSQKQAEKAATKEKKADLKSAKQKQKQMKKQQKQVQKAEHNKR
ncbi:MAG TPA: hypothetical protein VF753_12525 [Terriglobales bacterium]